MSNILYLECNSGISGDMTVAALLGLGADWEGLQAVFANAGIEGFQLSLRDVVKSGITCKDFLVELDEEHENHDHDMEYLHGNSSYLHDHMEAHAHGIEHEHHAHHEHRNLGEICKIIDRCALSEKANALAKRVFQILARAEAKAHGIPVEKVHFHEVGAIDSIVDIVAFAFCMDNLDIDEVIVPYVCEGQGTVRCQHGILSVPVPAVCNILAQHELPLRILDVTGELVTPTGAAIVAAVRTSGKLPQNFCIKKIGLGAGKREYETPGYVRAMMIEPKEA